MKEEVEVKEEFFAPNRHLHMGGFIGFYIGVAGVFLFGSPLLVPAGILVGAFVGHQLDMSELELRESIMGASHPEVAQSENDLDTLSDTSYMQDYQEVKENGADSNIFLAEEF